MAKPVKRFSTIDEQINVLTSRGLALDHAVADQWLRNVGYYRLSGYWYPYREIDDQPGGRLLDHFIAGASFDDVVRLYEFDRKLRTLLHDGIERGSSPFEWCTRLGVILRFCYAAMVAGAVTEPKRRSRTPLTAKQIDAIHTARDSGESVMSIARRFDVSRMTVWEKTRATRPSDSDAP